MPQNGKQERYTCWISAYECQQPSKVELEDVIHSREMSKRSVFQIDECHFLWTCRNDMGCAAVSSDSDRGWSVIHGKFIAINSASMSCACPRSPKGLSPSAHLADGTTDLILVRKCSRLDFFKHLLRHTNNNDQVARPKHAKYFRLNEREFRGTKEQNVLGFSRRICPIPKSESRWTDEVLKSWMSKQKAEFSPLAVLAPTFADSAQFPKHASLQFKCLSPCAFPRVINNLHPDPERLC